MIHHSFQVRLTLLLVLFSASTWAAAETIAPPEGEVVLRVSGDIGSANVGQEAHFDMATLETLPVSTFTTSTNWTTGPQEFSGVLLKTLLDRLDVRSGVLTATAINDYAVEIPVSDAVEDGPIIAYLRNGEPMSVRDKGPLWVIYPYDSNREYQSEVVYARSIWQLNRLSVSQ